PARLHVRRDGEHHPRVFRVVSGYEEDVASRLVELRLVHAARAHPEPVGILAGREIAVREAADRVQTLDLPQVALAHEVLDRERGGEEAEAVEPPPGLRDLPGQPIALPELRLEVAPERIVDHET